ncbi:U4/U6.U5 small nuclear ribonucleoprotein [Actinidia chinensis var. chinensis]|uniref:U4/U6.U5 small nuclear ribonucleoprotein n=1 Tax=Actinidia chinensis var. chinensis TaxID=1590841 RepID=A0A2R6NX28_ACTCC|nr:U4/U6.U5 small nuclear ribonucleoprotein [Actinidia chinensis var. chinensis]
MSDRERVRDRDRDRDRRREKDDRERDRRDRDRSKRSRTPDRTRSRPTRSRTRSPDRHRSPDRSGRRHAHHRSPSPDPPRKRQKHEDDKDRKRAAAAVSDFVDGIAKEQKKQHKGSADEGVGADVVDGEMDADEIEMMKKFGIPVGFDSTKGKQVPGADVSGVRAVTKRQPRQYMNRRGGFNRPLPAEINR